MEKLSPDEANLLKNICLRREIDLSELKNNRTLLACEIGGLDAFVEQLSQSYRALTKIVIIGDYDVDGAVSTALLFRGLNALGFQKVSHLAPKRMSDGYGLSPELVERLAGQECGILITVDNGIRAFEGVHAAQQRGWKVFITDHHLPAKEGLPSAELILNPKLDGQKSEPCYVAAQNLAGVGVVFYALKRLYEHFVAEKMLSIAAIEEANPENWLDLVALGTIADMVLLDATNRALVMKGLKIMRSAQGSLGIQALLKQVGYGPTRLPHHSISTRTLSCQVAPLINAAGRVDDIAIAIDLLISQEPQTIGFCLKKLIEFNFLRKQKQAQMLDLALGQLKAQHSSLPAALTLADERFHVGIVGILASQIKMRCQRPTAVFGKIEANRRRGSIRSIPQAPLVPFLEKLVLHHPTHILQAGGHAFAAGVTLTDGGLKVFADAFEAHLSQANKPSSLEVVARDGFLPESLLNLRTLRLLNYWIPWGAGCEEPCFEGEFFILEHQKIGQEGQKFSLRFVQGLESFSAITFNGAHLPPSELGQALYTKPRKFCYRVGINAFAGVARLQLHLEAIDWAIED